jgi:hypothetical protein
MVLIPSRLSDRRTTPNFSLTPSAAAALQETPSLLAANGAVKNSLLVPDIF